MLFFAAGQFDRVEQHAAQGLSRWQAHLLAIFLCRRLSARRWACAKIRQTTRSPAPCPAPTWPLPCAHLRPARPPHRAQPRAHLHRALPCLPRLPHPRHLQKTARSRKHQAPGTETMCRIRLHEIFRADALRTISCCAFVHAEPARIPLLNSCLYMRCGKTLRVQTCLVLPGHVPLLESAQGRTSIHKHGPYK